LPELDAAEETVGTTIKVTSRIDRRVVSLNFVLILVLTFS